MKQLKLKSTKQPMNWTNGDACKRCIGIGFIALNSVRIIKVRFFGVWCCRMVMKERCYWYAKWIRCTALKHLQLHRTKSCKPDWCFAAIVIHGFPFGGSIAWMLVEAIVGCNKFFHSRSWIRRNDLVPFTGSSFRWLFRPNRQWGSPRIILKKGRKYYHLIIKSKPNVN